MQKIKEESVFRKQIGEDRLTVAIFKTTWCKDCHYIEPFIGEVEAAYSDRLTMVEVDREDMADLCSELNILGIPSFIAFRKGQELVRFVNKLRKTREEIEQFLDRAVEVYQALNSK
jgi:thioredoxin-like negative regulator of GroEL